MIKLSSTLAFTTAMLTTFGLAVPAIAQPKAFTVTGSGSQIQILSDGQALSGTIRGMAGGGIDSAGCGWMKNTPNHTLSIQTSGIVSMTIAVSNPNNNPQPYTLMIKNASDPGAAPFCAIADPFSGIKAEIGGVWNQGQYEVYVGNFETANQESPYQLTITP